MKDYINVIGGGLAGCEAAYQIAKRGIKVKLYEMKPSAFSPAHSSNNLAEVVCSNSFKSNAITNACGLLKQELRELDSLLIRCADLTAVPAGQALAVDRDEFSKLVTKSIEENENIEVIRKEFFGSLENDAIMCGKVTDREELANYYSRADLFLFPSVYDASSIVQIEAASQSTPAVFLKNTATAATVTDNVNGFLSDYTVGAYSDKIIEVMNDKELYNKVSKNAYLDLYKTWKQMVDKAYELYKEFINKKM